MNRNCVEVTDKIFDGFAYHEIITDAHGKATDYKFLYVNEAFEKLTGLKKKDVLNRNVTEVLPDIIKAEFDWIHIYGEVATKGEKITFTQYSEMLNTWYEVSAFSDRKGHFSTVFRPIAKEFLEKKLLDEIVEISEEYLTLDLETLDYSKICRSLRKISRSLQVKFYLREETGNGFREMAVAGRNSDTVVEEAKENQYSRIIEKKGRVFGKIVIVMKPGEDLQNEAYIRILITILGQYFEQQQIQQNLKQESQQMFLLFDHLDAPVYVVDMDTYEILYMNEVGKEEFGEPDGKACWNLIRPDLSKPCADCPITVFKEEKGSSVKKRKEYYHEEKKCWFHRTDTVMEWPEGRRVKLTVAFDVSDRKKVEEQEQYLRTVMANAHDSIIAIDDNFTITYVNKKTEELFGYDKSELIGENVSRLYPEYERIKVRKEIFPILKAGKNYVGELIGKKKDGNTFFCEISASPIKGNRENAGGYIGIQRDITEQKRMLKELILSNQRYDELSKHSGAVTWETDEKGLYTFVNPIVEDVFGYTPEDLVGKVHFYDIFIPQEKEKLKNKFFHIFKDKKPFRNVVNSIEGKGGDKITVSTNGIPILNEDGSIRGFKGIDIDITERIRKERRVEYLSFHDHLTGLYNRRYLEHSFQEFDKQGSLPMAIIAVDVNGLKLTNDTYGHDMGDRLLKAVAKVLEKACSREEIVARTGGDEFIILLPNSSKRRVERIVKRVNRLTQEIALDSVIVSLAIGYAVKTQVDENLWDVLKVADNRMYKNKVKHGKVMRSQTIETVLRSINLKYDKEQIHTERVSLYCEALAKALGLPEDEVEKVKTMGILHDIGKITVSPAILNKVGKLTENEWNQIKQHPVTGYNILKSVEEYESLAYAVLHHHERWDGGGYPGGLKGNEIPYYARIVNVADAFEAMTAQRAYHKPKTNEEASAELIRCAGSQFDPDIVKVFVEKVLDA